MRIMTRSFCRTRTGGEKSRKPERVDVPGERAG
jgi:hypothetical protein